jgi:hypothetical protein
MINLFKDILKIIENKNFSYLIKYLIFRVNYFNLKKNYFLFKYLAILFYFFLNLLSVMRSLNLF